MYLYMESPSKKWDKEFSELKYTVFNAEKKSELQGTTCIDKTLSQCISWGTTKLNDGFTMFGTRKKVKMSEKKMTIQIHWNEWGHEEYKMRRKMANWMAIYHKTVHRPAAV